MVLSGDISSVPADALITAVNSGGAWFGGIDSVISNKAGDGFHEQVAKALPLRHGQTVNATRVILSRAAFKNVVFVIDDLEGPLSDIIYNGLVAASNAGYESVSLPTIRMGVMLGVVEKTPGEAVDQMVEGVERFILKHSPSTTIKSITFVVYGGGHIKSMLEQRLSVN